MLQATSFGRCSLSSMSSLPETRSSKAIRRQFGSLQFGIMDLD